MFDRPGDDIRNRYLTSEKVLAALEEIGDENTLVDLPITIEGSMGHLHLSHLGDGVLRVPKEVLIKMISYARGRHFVNIGINCGVDIPKAIRDSQLEIKDKK